MAWLVFMMTIGYTGAKHAGGFVVPFYQWNDYKGERSDTKRVTMGRKPMDYANNFPIVGNPGFEETLDKKMQDSSVRPVYLRYPSEIGTAFTSVPAGDRQYTMRGLVLEVTADTDVSAFL
jgi:hypothetical protein